MKSGQILIFVLLVVVVALAVGLSVASRNITNLRTSTQTGESQRAFSAAEGGVEDMLSRISAITSVPAKNLEVNSTSGYTGQVTIGTVGDLPASVKLKGINVYQMQLVPGEVGQINLSGYPAAPITSGIITVEWIQSSTSEDVFPRASIELTFVCENSKDYCDTGPASGFSQRRFAFQKNGEPISGQNGFTDCLSAGTGFVCKNPVTLCIPTAGNVNILRIRPFHNTAT